MNTRFVLSVAVVSAVALVSPAHGGTEQGMVEMNGSAAFATAVGEHTADASAYAISTQVTYFATDAFSVGGRLTFTGASAETWDGEVSESALGLYAVADAHLAPASTVVPFLGGAIGFERYSQEVDYEDWWRNSRSIRETDKYDNTEVIVEFHGGAKAFIRDNVAVTMEARYRTSLEDFADVGTFGLLAGLSVFLF
jgi:hypothetical protein